MPTHDDPSRNEQDRADRVPENPKARLAETVDALADEDPDTDPGEEGVAAEDVTENPETDDLEGLPGPSRNEPGESAG